MRDMKEIVPNKSTPVHVSIGNFGSIHNDAALRLTKWWRFKNIYRKFMEE
jgi:hypothetical protein